MRNPTKRVFFAVVGLVLAGAMGACSDEPMAVEEAYEVQMDGEGGGNGTCIYIDGQLYCD